MRLWQVCVTWRIDGTGLWAEKSEALKAEKSPACDVLEMENLMPKTEKIGDRSISIITKRVKISCHFSRKVKSKEK